MVVNDATVENLRDAGCDDSLISQFLELTQTEQTEARMNLLSRHRMALLDQLHRDQKRIDCLDYLLYKMRKEKQGDSIGGKP